MFGEGHDERIAGRADDDTIIGDSRIYQPGTDRAMGGRGEDRGKAGSGAAAS